MNPVQAFVVGIAPDHLPALIAAILLPVVVLLVRRMRVPVLPGDASEAPTVRPQPDPVRLWVAWLMGISAAVHLALPLGHVGEPGSRAFGLSDGVLLAVMFVGSGAAYAWLALRAWEGRTYRLWSALLIVATLIAYLVVTGRGDEEPDQVGIATALVELAALGLCLVPQRAVTRPKRFQRFAGSSATIFVTFVVGAVVWVGSLAAHSSTDTDATTDHEHAHDHAARAQAGVVMRPQAGSHPTADQEAAAQALADATKASLARYARLDDALAAGYVLPANRTATDVHVENPAYKKDGVVLDPQRPETLVYVIDGGRATLLGAMFEMEWAGVPGPQPGGAATRWHAHNICVSVLPPGFGIVDPFGGCPGLSLAVTSPEMMHVWIVDNPNGPFAEGLDGAWERAYNAEHGLPYP